MFTMAGDRAGRGVAWQAYASVVSAQTPSFPMTVPQQSGFSWVNQGSSTFTQTAPGGPTVMVIAPNASLNWRGLFITQPSPPYKIRVQIRALSANVNSQTTGLYFYDGTKLYGIEVLNQAGSVNTLRVEKITNVTTDGSTAASVILGIIGSMPIWLQLRNSGTTLNFDYGLDGVNFVNLFSESVGVYMTPTQVGWGGLNATTSNVLHNWLLNWAYYPDAALTGL
jgi:hypothetical protein